MNDRVTPFPDDPWLREQIVKRKLSYTIMSAVWLGRLTPEQKKAAAEKRARDNRIVDMILAGHPVPRDLR